jgi:C-terminal processing protease CtpA/Prc
MYKKDTYPDGREFVGYGIKPNIVVKKTLNDYLNKKDPVLERAIEYLKERLK